MSARRVAASAMFAVSFACMAVPAEAAFHLWFIKEAYTNPSGSVQFIELFTSSNSQEFLSGQSLTSNSHTFNFPSNSPSPTANHHLLLATAGFGSIPGGAAPDFTIASNFFSSLGDTLDFASGVDTKTFASAPSDGINSLNYTGQFSASTIAANSPRNYAGAGSSINVPEPAAVALITGGIGMMVHRRRALRKRRAS